MEKILVMNLFTQHYQHCSTVCMQINWQICPAHKQMNHLTILWHPRLQKQDTTQTHQVYSLDFVQVLVRKMKVTST